MGIWDFSPDALAHISPELRRAQLAGIYKPAPSAPYSGDHCHDSLDLAIITHGSTYHIYGDDKRVDSSAGQVIIIPGGNRHRFIIDENSHVCCYSVEIPPAIFHSLSHSPELQPIVHRLLQTANPLPYRVISDPTVFLSLKNIFEEMLILLHETDNPCNTHILQFFSKILALYVAKLMQGTSTTFSEHPSVQRVLEVQAWLDRHFAEPITVDDMAQMAMLSQQHFCHLFHKVTGVSPKAYLLSRRLEHAAFLLTNSHLPIVVIALNVGFNGQGNFTSAFTKFTGLTPSDYRKKYQLSQPSDGVMNS